MTSTSTTAATGRLLDTGEGPVHIYDYGGEGRLHLLVHGLEGSHANWASVGPELARYGRVVAVDLIGFGHTPPVGRRSDLRSNRDLVGAVVDVLAEGPATVVGVSMGGLVAMLVGDRRPEAVDRLVLVCTGQPKPRGVSFDWRLSAAFVAITLPGIGEAALWARDRLLDAEEEAERTLERVTAEFGALDPVAHEAFVRMARERAEMPWSRDAFLQAARSMLRELSRPRGFPGFVRRLAQPALVVQGGADPLVNPAASQALAALREDWHLEVLDGVGHEPPLEAPGRLVDAIVRWSA